MKHATAFRITSEICFFNAIFFLFPFSEGFKMQMALFTLACFVFGIAACLSENPIIRLILALIPGAFLFMGPIRLTVLIPMLAWLFFVLSVKEERDIIVSEYRKTFIFMFAGSIFALVVSAFNFVIDTEGTWKVDSIIYIALFAFLGIIALRLMQMGVGMDLRWHLAGASTVLALVAFLLGGSFGMYYFFKGLRLVLGFLITPVRMLLAWLFSLFREHERVIKENPLEGLVPEPDGESELPVIDSPEVQAVQKMDYDTTLPQISDNTIMVFLWILLAVAFVIAVFVVIKLSKRGNKEKEKESTFEDTEGFSYTRTKAKHIRKERALGPAARVRKIYAQYLSYLEKNGLRRREADTSLEILERSGLTDVESAEEEKLRGIYLKARYGNGDVTEDDVAIAKRSLENIMK
ncbi:MAG: DUF4129 domain-containing protein [Lachnospiraceae bacterium]|nr:DUF4129 domain-containing protein [Lachnospiraceae bacterium]